MSFIFKPDDLHALRVSSVNENILEGADFIKEHFYLDQDIASLKYKLIPQYAVIENDLKKSAEYCEKDNRLVTHGIYMLKLIKSIFAYFYLSSEDVLLACKAVGPFIKYVKTNFISNLPADLVKELLSKAKDQALNGKYKYDIMIKMAYYNTHKNIN